jgi:hypothetical protein
MAKSIKTPITVEGDITASNNLRSSQSSGDEGGQIFLSKAATNTTLTSGVNIDIYQNKLRIWEDGSTPSTTRGFFLDMTTGGNSVGTSLTGYTLIASTAFSSAPTFSSIPQTYKKLVAVINFTNMGTFSTSLTYNFNATNTGYSRIIPGTGTSFTTSAGAAAILSTVVPTAGNSYVVEVENYTYPKAIARSYGDCFTLSAPIAAAVTSMAFAASTSWGGAAGTAYLYGIN